ncbi:flagellar biosynthetic protein FliR, partial [Tautonia sociabilis]
GLAGLSAATSLAPGADDGPIPPTATLGGLIALAAFAALDGPFRLALALAGSYGIATPGGTGAGRSLEGAGPIDEQAIRLACAAVGQALGLALRLAAPVALALLVAQVAVGLLARAAPALASFTAWLPLRLALGLALLLLGVAGMATALISAWSSALPGG